MFELIELCLDLLNRIVEHLSESVEIVDGFEGCDIDLSMDCNKFLAGKVNLGEWLCLAGSKLEKKNC